MTEEPKKKNRNRENEYARRKLARKNAAAAEKAEQAGKKSEKELFEELALLAVRTGDNPTDTDRDIDFAYRNAANPTITPRECPSLGAWKWLEYARDNHAKFLEICAKREDAKAKAAGSISAQRMEDDKRQQFAVIDRIIKQLELDVKAAVKDMMEKCPEDMLNAARKHKAAWNAYFQKFPLDPVQ